MSPRGTPRKVVEQAPFNGLLDWVRSNIGDDEAAAIERARGDTTDGLRAQLSLKDEALADKDEALREARAEIAALKDIGEAMAL